MQSQLLLSKVCLSWLYLYPIHTFILAFSVFFEIIQYQNFQFRNKSIFFCNKLNLVINTHLKFANIMGNLAILFALLSCWPALRNHIIFLKIIRMIRQEKLRNHKSLNYSIASVSWLNICKIKCLSLTISLTINSLVH